MTSSTRQKNDIVTLKDIAEQCGVTVATVSRALQNPARHSKETTARVVQAAAELGYDPLYHQGARRLALSRFGKLFINHLIAVIFPPYFYRANYFTEVFQGLLDVLTPAGFGLLTLDAPQDAQVKLPPSFSRGDVDGVIGFVPAASMARIAARLRDDSGFGPRPILSLLFPTAGCSTVLIDARGGAQAAATHLLDLGHRHLLHFCGSKPGTEWAPYDWAHEMLLGYEQACHLRGLDPATHLHYLKLDDKLHDIAFNATKHPKLSALEAVGLTPHHPLLRILHAHPGITAILAPNDPTALLIRHILQQATLRVPDDLSLIGFDDTNPMFDARGRNMLTTVRLPLRQVGRRAARLLINQINRQSYPETLLSLPATLVIRHSTTPPRG